MTNHISTKIDWMIANTPDGWWIGLSPALKISAQAKTKDELEVRIKETQDALFKTLSKKGQLETFLAVHDWQPEIGTMEQVDARSLADALC